MQYGDLTQFPGPKHKTGSGFQDVQSLWFPCIAWKPLFADAPHSEYSFRRFLHS